MVTCDQIITSGADRNVVRHEIKNYAMLRDTDLLKDSMLQSAVDQIMEGWFYEAMAKHYMHTGKTLFDARRKLDELIAKVLILTDGKKAHYLAKAQRVYQQVVTVNGPIGEARLVNKYVTRCITFKTVNRSNIAPADVDEAAIAKMARKRWNRQYGQLKHEAKKCGYSVEAHARQICKNKEIDVTQLTAAASPDTTVQDGNVPDGDDTIARVAPLMTSTPVPTTSVPEPQPQQLHSLDVPDTPVPDDNELVPRIPSRSTHTRVNTDSPTGASNEDVERPTRSSKGTRRPKASKPTVQAAGPLPSTSLKRKREHTIGNVRKKTCVNDDNDRYAVGQPEVEPGAEVNNDLEPRSSTRSTRTTTKSRSSKAVSGTKTPKNVRQSSRIRDGR